ncbi:hypothetical protein JOB18_008777 [Solea senegalensis]|uniref:Uncharacterized protein n=1 Tax=Solea senegalensis TaxID=28829 RepID=A0AAV6SDG3_SOLSE|nr:hypothetical protein JOB18_008777 [Solea senegalensis]
MLSCGDCASVPHTSTLQKTLNIHCEIFVLLHALFMFHVFVMKSKLRKRHPMCFLPSENKKIFFDSPCPSVSHSIDMICRESEGSSSQQEVVVSQGECRILNESWLLLCLDSVTVVSPVLIRLSVY